MLGCASTTVVKADKATRELNKDIVVCKKEEGKGNERMQMGQKNKGICQKGRKHGEEQESSYTVYCLAMCQDACKEL